MKTLPDLAVRYLYARQEMDPAEFTELAALLRRDPELARDLAEMLMMDDLLSRTLDEARQDFAAGTVRKIEELESGSVGLALMDDLLSRTLDQTRTDFETGVLRRIKELEAEAAPQVSAGQPDMTASKRKVIKFRKPAQQAGTASCRVQRQPRAGWRVFVPVAVAACAVGAFLLFHQTPMNQAGQAAPDPAAMAFMSVAEPATQVERQGQVLPTEPGMALATGDRVCGRAVIRYANEESLLVLAAGADLALGLEDGAKHLRLDSGNITCRIAPQPAGKNFRIVTPHAEVEVVGTQFTLTVASDQTRLEVAEGQVRLVRTPDQAAVVVTTGQFAVAKADMPLTAQLSPPSPAAPPLAWRDQSDAGMSAFCSDDTVVLQAGKGASATTRPTANLARTFKPEARIRITGAFSQGPAGGMSYLEFTQVSAKGGMGNLRLVFLSDGKVRLESRAGRMGFSTHGKTVAFDPAAPVKFDLAIERGEVVCEVGGNRLYAGKHLVKSVATGWRLGLRAEPRGAGQVGAFSELSVQETSDEKK